MTTARQRRQNTEAGRAQQRNQRDLDRLDAAQGDLDALPPAAPGGPEAARRQAMQDAIDARRQQLTDMNQLMDDYVASEDDAERERLRDAYNALRDQYRDTSGLGGGRVDDPCVPCSVTSDIWDVVDVRPTTWQRQYVNLDRHCRPQPTPREQHSRTIRVTAQIQPAKRGKTVFWTLHADPANRTLHFSQGATTAPVAPQPPLPLTHAASLSVASSRTNARGIASVELTMGLYGGDRFQVSASATAPTGPPGPAAAGAPLRTAVFEVWRKLWYGVVEMQQEAGGVLAMPAASINAAVAAYQACFVELLDSGERRQGRFQENFETHQAAYRWADRYTTRAYTPWKVVYSAVDYVVPLANRQQRTLLEPSVTTVDATLTGTFSLYDFRVGQRAARRQWFISASATDLNTGATVRIPRAKFTRTGGPPSGPTTLQVNLDGIGLANPVSAANPVSIQLDYYHAPGYNGWGGSNLHLMICRGSMDVGYGAGVAVAMGGTCTHEPGHALGLVYAPLGWRSTTAGQESHCSVRACVMWFQGYVGRPVVFHTAGGDPNCHTFVRGKNMSYGNMQIWKFPR